jgi:ribonuclease P protein component
MLPARHRMRRSTDFARTIRHGRRAGTPLLVAHLLVDVHTDPAPLVGFVVPKAVGGSVQRKRVLRRLRHLMREHVAGLPDGCLLVVRALPGAAEAGYADLGRALDSALLRCAR